MSDITHIVKSYEEELQNLNDNLIKMGSLVEAQLSDYWQSTGKVLAISTGKVPAKYWQLVLAKYRQSTGN